MVAACLAIIAGCQSPVCTAVMSFSCFVLADSTEAQTVGSC